MNEGGGHSRNQYPTLKLESLPRETNERNRRMSENETDMKVQTEAMDMLSKYGYFSKNTKIRSMDIRQAKLSKDNEKSVTRDNG